MRLGGGYNALESQRTSRVAHDGFGGFVGVALAPKALQKREAEVDVVEVFAFQHAANSDQLC